MSRTPSARAKTAGGPGPGPRTRKAGGKAAADTAGHEPPIALVRAARAAAEKKATDVVALDLRQVQAFTDFFLICTGQNTRQVRAIADAVEAALGKHGEKPAHVEGYDRANWILLDYFSFVVHVFAPEARAFYDIERLWGSASRLSLPDAAG
ncbi:MAG TPA: ribosome silencing factor [Vicinamibacterales bacterium]|nr:ribosome silencing factor [Vicinamibacterales bacterium]HOG28871.1 ribosome silencing factor [Vicinamibacterales bacterium]HOQ60327.1 ribosome silencing factor [Vicinamibacterales bacterium]HPK71946.1 ribosome silencing factor [Vicinamibacterales bacterium]HPW19849.1 ribosome silencing factor [Vicinamibacterales bacterium]